MTKAAERFATALENGVPLQRAAVDAELVSLARALQVAGRASGPAPVDADFRAALRQRLVAVATVQEPAAAPIKTGALSALSLRVGKRVSALAGAVTVATSFAGVGVAAAHSLPGNPFYGLKRATEDVQLWATRGDEAKGKRHLEFARTRLAEAQKLHDPSRVVSALHAMDSQTRQGSAELMSVANSQHSAGPLDALDVFASQQITDLGRLARSNPSAAVQQAQAQSVGVLVQVAASTTSARTSLASAGIPPAKPGGPGHRAKPGPGTPTPTSIRPTPSAGSSGGTSPSPTHSGGSTSHPTPSKKSVLPTKLPTLPSLPVKIPSIPVPDVTKLLP